MVLIYLGMFVMLDSPKLVSHVLGTEALHFYAIFQASDTFQQLKFMGQCIARRLASEQ